MKELISIALFTVPLLLAEHFADVSLSSMQITGARRNLLANKIMRFSVQYCISLSVSR